MMKYAVVLCDGMADYPVPELGGKTPMAVANKPHMDDLARRGTIGLVKTVDDSMTPGSDVANLSVMGYDPKQYYTGRSPLEAISMGIDLKDSDVTVRCNLVTLSDDEPFAEKKMVDYCADDISTAEAAQLIDAVQQALGNEIFCFYAGVSYRHCLVWHDGVLALGALTPPHDIPGRVIREYLPSVPAAQPLCDLMERAYEVLKDHPVNQARIARGKRPGNGIWLWGQGSRPQLDAFEEKFGVRGTVISAVDLIKGIGVCAGMQVRNVTGATGYIDTNFEGKAQAALQALADGQDFVYIHLEAPDECGHRHEVENKVRAIELIDAHVLAPLLDGLNAYDNYRVLILPDHPTPMVTRTHARDAVPFVLFEKATATPRVLDCFNEDSAKASGVYVEKACDLMAAFLRK